MLAQVPGTGQRGELVEQAVFAEQLLTLAHLRGDGVLFLLQVVHAQGQQQHAQRHGRSLQPVIPGRLVGQADEFVEGVHPHREGDEAQAQGKQAGDPASRAPA
ncbi:hypothetical protein D3C72_2012830 [compost metagenome]